MIKNFLICFLIVGAIACGKFVPSERETIGLDSDFPQNEYSPYLGRTTVFSDIFYKGSTTYPADFTIENVRRRNGNPAPELTNVFPVTVWKQGYTGLETSLEEIEAKRVVENRPLLEVKEHSGEIVLWAPARSNFVRAYPDSGYLFDIKVSNTGGTRYFKGIKLMPYREQPYYPSNLNAVSGMPVTPGVRPTDIFMQGDSTGRYLGSNDVDIYIRKIDDGTATSNKLTFMFLDKNDQFINPDMFSATDWPNLIHGFNMQKTATSVSYQVAYPIPLVPLRTRYTTGDGSLGSVRFAFERFGFAGVRQTNYVGLNFAIYDPGNWEIVVKFKFDNPKFRND
ncbi:MAG: DUF5007 domain-containing protein [Niabella sp.]